MNINRIIWLLIGLFGYFQPYLDFLWSKKDSFVTRQTRPPDSGQFRYKIMKQIINFFQIIILNQIIHPSLDLTFHHFWRCDFCAQTQLEKMSDFWKENCMCSQNSKIFKKMPESFCLTIELTLASIIWHPLFWATIFWAETIFRGLMCPEQSGWW